MARAAYNTGKYSEDYDRQGYVVDKELSDVHRTVFFNPQNKRAVVSYRGTKVSDVRDLAADLAIVRGSEGSTPRFKQSLKLAEKAIKKYGKENVTLTGHSLGGSQAIYVGHKTGLTAHAFNPGVGPKTGIKEVFARFFRSKSKGKNVNIYHTGKKDLISVLSPLMRGNVRAIAPKLHKNAHGIDNFIF